MEVITEQQFYDRLDEIIDDVAENKKYYKVITANEKEVMVIPYNDFDVLKWAYESWIEEDTPSIYKLDDEQIS